MPKAKKNKKVKLSPEAKKQKSEQRRFRQNINTVFKNLGFNQIATRDQQFDVNGQRGDIDALFYYENIIVLSEDTCSESSSREHVNKTGLFFAHLDNHKIDFVNYLEKSYPSVKKDILSKYDLSELHIKYIYCSKAVVEKHHLEHHDILTYVSNTSLKYFLSLSRTIHKSGRFELMKFLGISLEDIGNRASGQNNTEYPAFVLPETPSGFPHGYKVVSFYVDPASLIERAYVLRKDSWSDSDSLYQRILIKNKIKNMREYLAVSKKVYINNIIVSLPDNTSFKDLSRNPVELNKIQKTGQYYLILPSNFNCVGIIDGQHRVFSYYEGSDQHEQEISKRRIKQQLIVTGVVFPHQATLADRAKFEAKLFLEINDKQSRAKADLKHSIETIISPFTSVALAKSVIIKMARQGPLAGHLEEHFFGDGKIKTSSIVSYGLKNLVDPNSTNKSSLFSHWKSRYKKDMIADNNMNLRSEYIDFCVTTLNMFVSAFKANIPSPYWTTKRTESRALSTTTINGLIVCLRKIAENGSLPVDFEEYKTKFGKLNLNFTPKSFPYKSSHWRSLGEEIYKQCFQS